MTLFTVGDQWDKQRNEQTENTNKQTNKPSYVLPKLGATKTWTFFQYCKNSHKAAAINIAQRDTEAAPNDISRTTADRQ